MLLRTFYIYLRTMPSQLNVKRARKRLLKNISKMYILHFNIRETTTANSGYNKLAAQ